MTIQTKLKLHCDISSVELEAIIIIKSLRWSYSKKQHKAWIDNNLLPDDYHLLVYKDNTLIAYANFINIKVLINDDIFDFRGIGNVCTCSSGKAYGNILMEFINIALTNKSWHGLLFCQTELVGYYQKFGWKLVSSDKIVDTTTKDTNTLVFNFNETIFSLNHYGKFF